MVARYIVQSTREGVTYTAGCDRIEEAEHIAKVRREAGHEDVTIEDLKAERTPD